MFFPILLANTSLVSCFPSTLFSPLLYMKTRFHVAMKTWWMDATNFITIHCDTIDPSTWAYKIKHLPVPDDRHTICKATYIGEDDGVVEKWRGLKEVTTLSQSHHLELAQIFLAALSGWGLESI
jgi:hypothetical protein